MTDFALRNPPNENAGIYTNVHTDVQHSPSNEFMVESFLPFVDKLVAALSQRLGAYYMIRVRFGFLSQLDSIVSNLMGDKAMI